MRLILFRPVPEKFRISSPFGITRTLRHSNGQTVTRVHHGIDFEAPVGTPIQAMFDGEIFITGWEKPDDHQSGLGFRVWQKINYEDRKVYGWYAHLSKIMVEPGDKVKAGQVIALSGFNGSATGPHLHVQFREVNTGDWLDAEFKPFEELLNDRTDNQSFV